MLSPPRPPKLPSTLARSRVERPRLDEVKLTLRTITPILGGGHRTRSVDEVDLIRVPSIRGGLRFWWRALYGGEFKSSQDLYKAEAELWGGLLKGEKKGDSNVVRSPVEVRVDGVVPSDIARSDIEMGSADAYALWPARAERGTGSAPAPRREPGMEFGLSLRFPQERSKEVTNAVRAWILFGGYGGRTRRGVGSLTVKTGTGGVAAWLPSGFQREALALHFGVDVLAPERAFLVGDPPQLGDLPQLGGATLSVGIPHKDALKIWRDALGWLREFRQGAAKSRVTTPQSSTARDYNPGRGQAAAGRSFWPEADKVRCLSGTGPWAHAPRYNATPLWPRAGFGLPIVGKFQQNAAKGSPSYQYPEPRDFKLIWQDDWGNPHDRLASPLIVKAVPLADGTFVPIWLWLNRSDPKGGKVGVVLGSASRGVGFAPFDLLTADGDAALYAPLDTPAVKGAPAGQCLRRAFMDWLNSKPGIKGISK